MRLKIIPCLLILLFQVSFGLCQNELHIGDFVVIENSQILYKVEKIKKSKLKLSSLDPTGKRTKSIKVNVEDTNPMRYQAKIRDTLITFDDTAYKLYWIFEETEDKYFQVTSIKGGLTWPESKPKSFLDQVKKVIILEETEEELQAEEAFQLALKSPVNFSVEQSEFQAMDLLKTWQSTTNLYAEIKQKLRDKESQIFIHLESFEEENVTRKNNVGFFLDSKTNIFYIRYSNALMTPHRDEKFLKGVIKQKENGLYTATLRPNKIARRIYFDFELTNILSNEQVLLTIRNIRSN